MNRRLVSIFGGLKAQPAHFRLAYDVYHALGFNVRFYGPPLLGLGLLIPSMYRQNVRLAHAENVRYDFNIVHSSSAGYFAALELSAKSNADGCVIEAGPMECTTPTLIQTWARVHPKSALLKRIPVDAPIDFYLSRCGTKYMPLYFSEASRAVKDLVPSLVIIGEQDTVIDRVFVESFVKQTGSRLVSIPQGSHHRLAKVNPQHYQTELESYLRQRIKLN